MRTIRSLRLCTSYVPFSARARARVSSSTRRSSRRCTCSLTHRILFLFLSLRTAWDMMGRDLMKKYWLPWLVSMPAETSLAICSFIFGGIFERLPRLRVLFAHGGGSFPATVGRVQHGFDCRPDLCAVDNPISPEKYLGRFWVDSLMHGVAALRYVSSLLGSESICLGSDYPFPLGECYPLKRPGDLIVESGLSNREKRNMLGENALRWLGVRESRRAMMLSDAKRRRDASAASAERLLARNLVGVRRLEETTRGIGARGSVELHECGTFECMLERPAVALRGKWKIGTYASDATPTGDVVLRVMSAERSSSSSSSAIAEDRASPWVPQEPPYEIKIHVNEKGNVSGPLGAFREEHVRRRSGKNDLIEGQKVSRI